MARLIKKPLQIYLRDDQERTLRALAEQEGVSLAELIRRSIDGYVNAKLPVEDDPSLGIIALGHSGQPGLSTMHDEVVAREAAATSDKA
jgi:hypothetical protein